MSRAKSTFKQAVELYLIIVEGAYTLTALVALISNTQWLLTTTDQTEARGLRSDIGDNWLMLITAGVTLTAGVGIHKYRGGG